MQTVQIVALSLYIVCLSTCTASPPAVSLTPAPAVHTPTPTATATQTSTPTATAPPTRTPTATMTPSSTPVPPLDTPTATHTPAATPSRTPLPTSTATATPLPPGTPPPSSPTPAPARWPDMERRVFEAVNRQRAARDLSPLARDERLAAVARAHARDMVARDYAGHVTPEGTTFRQRLAAAGLAPYWAGENYYISYRPPVEAVETAIAWFMGDPPHRDNILHPQYLRLGVGVARNARGGYVLVLDFAGEASAG